MFDQLFEHQSIYSHRLDVLDEKPNKKIYITTQAHTHSKSHYILFIPHTSLLYTFYTKQKLNTKNTKTI